MKKLLSIVIGVSALSIGTVFAVQAMMPSGHEMAVKAWNTANGEVHAVKQTLKVAEHNLQVREKFELEKFCEMVRFAQVEKVKITQLGAERYKRECVIEVIQEPFIGVKK